MHETFDSAVVHEWSTVALDGLGAARAEIDALNVFPVPDGDTGTNLFLTAESAARSVEDFMAQTAADGIAAPDVAAMMKAFAHGALLGARGNSGVITSQLLRGISAVVREYPDETPLGGAFLAAALTRASELAYLAVAAPKEGTVLTVARCAAEAANATVERSADSSLAEVARAAAQEAAEALARTPDELPVLKEAGVVDSGGRGFVVIIDALVEVITGEARSRSGHRVPLAIPIESHTAAYGGPAYEVMFLLDGADELVPHMREKLGALGDSLVVVGGDGLWNVHVHVDDIGAAVEAGIEAGKPYRVKVTHLDEADERRKVGRGDTVSSPEDRTGRALVAVAHGPGVAALLLKAGVTVVTATPGRRPSTAELLDGIERSGAKEIILLPSDRDTLTVAEAAAGQSRDQGLRVAVIPTRSIVQSLAAVAVHEPGSHFDDDVVSMGREAGATRYGAVTTASRDAVTTAGVCRIGDVLGLVGGDIVEIGQDVVSTAARVLQRMMGSGADLVTIVSGADADQQLVDSVVAAASKGHSGIDVEVVDGQQPLWPLIIGVE